MIIVGKNEFIKTIQEALEKVTKDDYTIYIKRGVYHEKLVINKRVHLIGENSETTVITFNDYAKKIDEFGHTLETFRTSTMLILKDGVYLENLTIQNDSGRGEEIGQAVALFVNADYIQVTRCKIIGHQDTLLTGPIPKDAKNQEFLSFKMDHKANLYQYFDQCLIQGDVDFIFGSATAIFNNCTIFSNNIDKEINGYISAASTEQDYYGHIFYECKLISDAKKETVYLGRPWRQYANTVYIKCYMGSHIHRQAFAKWDDKHLCSRYFEYGSFGPGAFREQGLVKELSVDELKEYMKLINRYKK